MSYPLRLLACAGISLAVHLLLERGASLLPPGRSAARPPRPVTVRIVEPPRAVEPEPEPVEVDTTPVDQLPEPKVVPRPRTPKRPADEPQAAPPTSEAPAAAAEPSAPPAFGVTMESTSQGGSGPPMQTGSSAARPRSGGDPDARGGAGEGIGSGPAAPVEAYEVSVMPLPRGRCTGRYTEEARQAAIEGTVVLDLVVGADGRARDIKVVTGLPHGLSQAAVAALRACRFTPGERAGVPVPVRVREFKIRFFLQED